jgi:hypothetical protein
MEISLNISGRKFRRKAKKIKKIAFSVCIGWYE